MFLWGTVRLIMVTRGIRKWAVLIGFVEVTIWVVAISQVISNLNNVWNILGYSGGFAAGTFVGMYLENRLALRQCRRTCHFAEERSRLPLKFVKRAMARLSCRLLVNLV